MWPTNFQSPSLCLLSFYVILGMVAGIKKLPEVRLARYKNYITYSVGTKYNNSVIECNYELDEGEVLKQVTYRLMNGSREMGKYTWGPNVTPAANGLLDEAVKLDQDDGKLNLTTLRYNLAGDYMCQVDLIDGTKHISPLWKVLIVDIRTNTSLNHRGSNCKFVASFRGSTTFPDPTVKAGMFSKALGTYYQTVSDDQWQKVQYDNGSVSYSFHEVSFQIDSDLPLDAVFDVRVIISANNHDNEMFGVATNYSSWRDRGCPDLNIGPHMGVLYSPMFSSSCRGGRSNETKGTLGCANGYKGEDGVDLVTYQCDGSTRDWIPDPNLNQPEKLVCVEDHGNKCGQTEVSFIVLVMSLLLLLAPVLR